MTPAETSATVDGYIYNRQVNSSNFRALFALTFNQWAKKGEAKSPEALWPLPMLDDLVPKMTADEMFERNKQIAEWAAKNWDKYFAKN